LISDWTKRTWEKLQNMGSNEQAWEILEKAGAELVTSVIEPIQGRRFRNEEAQGVPEREAGPAPSESGRRSSRGVE